MKFLSFVFLGVILLTVSGCGHPEKRVVVPKASSEELNIRKIDFEERLSKYSLDKSTISTPSKPMEYIPGQHINYNTGLLANAEL